MNELSKSIAELVDSINHGAKAVGASFQNISPVAWRAVVYQVQLTAWIHMGIWLFIAGIAAYVSSKMRGIRKKLIADGDDRNEADTYEIWAWILTCVALLVAVVTIGENLITIMNPEYAAGVKIYHTLVKGSDN